LQGEVLAAHCYMVDKQTGVVMLMESGSLRLNEEYNAGKIAQANKLLHYYDIKLFKEKGLLEYDLGGWNKLQSLLEFKQAFGAQPITVYNYFTFAYHIRNKLKAAIEYWKGKLRATSK
jgi:lipid II:glycine glycyltransferase (peptidoglycan interpeptide bridge formation enzyme)